MALRSLAPASIQNSASSRARRRALLILGAAPLNTTSFLVFQILHVPSTTKVLNPCCKPACRLYVASLFENWSPSLAGQGSGGFLDGEAGCFLLMKYGWGRHTPSGRVRKLNAIYYLRYPMMNWIWSKIRKLRPQGGLDKQNYSFTRNFPVDWLTYSMQPDSVLQSMCRQY